jgi:hypothetical protein
MKHYLLKTLQEPKGFTDLFVVDAADWADISTDDLLKNVELASLKKGDIIFDDTTIDVVEALDPAPSANGTITASVGRTGSGYTDCIAASALMTTGTATAAGVAYAAGAAIGHQVLAADAKLYCQIDINDADGDLATVTKGEIRIWMRISRASDRVVEA